MTERRDQLHAIGRAYVSEGLAKKNFDAIPYHEDVELRAPIGPRGSEHPFIGREEVRREWWAPLPDLIGGAEVFETFVNDALDAVAVHFHLDVPSASCTLRIVDVFWVNADGEIVKQENFFDPRDVTHPGWRD